MELITAIKPPSYASPVAQTERILILDSLRGIALLGILLMNIPIFSFPGITDVSSQLPAKDINYYTWYLVSLIPDGTQRALFSMLFGAGILLFVRSQEKKVDGLQPADYFFRRQLWLIAFSLFDVFILLWQGDILLDYALLGMIMFAFRNLSAKHLLLAAGICMVLMVARENRDLYQNKTIIQKGEAIAAMDTSVIKLTPLQKDDLEAMKEFKARTSEERTLQQAAQRVRQVRGSYEQLYQFRTDRYIDNLVLYLFFGVWDVLQFMFLGMAFFKLGILTGEAKTKVYGWMAVIGMSVGILLSSLRLHSLVTYNFNGFDYAKNVVIDFYNLDRTFRALGFFGFILLLYKWGVGRWFFNLMRPVGQMAFTNYLMQSLLGGLFFYGIGFGLYGQLQRYQTYYVVGVIWLLQILYSHLWMRYFRFGPFEWLWRSLTYWKWQPMKKARINIVPPEAVSEA